MGELSPDVPASLSTSKDMVLSSYIYHHRGGEIYTALGINMPVMPPEEGIPEMGNRMINVIIDMANAYKAAQSDMMIIRFETITKNSANFNQTIKELAGLFVFLTNQELHTQAC